MKPAGKVIEFGPFRYDPGQHVLFREGEIVPLAPKAVDTLHALLDHRGRVVDKDELMKLVAKLSKLDGVHVISPSTVRRYERVGIAPNLMARMLWVGVTLEGVVQEADGRRRITARLTEQAGVIAAAVGARLRPSR